MAYKLIATDMDGTLLNGKGEISSENYQALKQAGDQGLTIVLATGRPYKSAYYHAKKLGLSCPIISSNGALIHDIDGNQVYKDLIDSASLETIAALVDESGLYYHLYTSDSVYSKTINQEILEKYYGDENGDLVVKPISFNNYREILNRGIDFNKLISISPSPEKLQALKRKLEQVKTIELTSSLENNIEIMNKHVSKKKALKYLCQQLDIDPSQVMALGDNANDLEMLDYAGLSIAMGNAIEEVKKRADFVTDTNDQSGWARAVKKFIL